MTKTNNEKSLYFWLGEEAEEVSEQEFKKRQKEWQGDRPSDFE